MAKKSIVIAGRHETSISLEDEFYEELVAIAREKNLSINQLVTQIDEEREIENLSSAIRLYILKYLKEK
ncbi:MAG: ribbon-helix-helix domain-containing protein [Alphaproteobacteria bacterium]